MSVVALYCSPSTSACSPSCQSSDWIPPSRPSPPGDRFPLSFCYVRLERYLDFENQIPKLWKLDSFLELWNSEFVNLLWNSKFAARFASLPFSRRARLSVWDSGDWIRSRHPAACNLRLCCCGSILVPSFLSSFPLGVPAAGAIFPAVLYVCRSSTSEDSSP
ncbi:unnamed protein product [Calypogeia fissa]